MFMQSKLAQFLVLGLIILGGSACSGLAPKTERTAENANEALKPAVNAINATPEATGRVAENARGALRPAVEKLQATPAAAERVLENAKDVVNSPSGKVEENEEEKQ